MQNNSWARLLAYVTSLVNQRLLLQCEYLIAENRILRSHLSDRNVHCFRLCRRHAAVEQCAVESDSAACFDTTAEPREYLALRPYRAALNELADRLDPARFVRVHRSAIVNIESIVRLGPDLARRI